MIDFSTLKELYVDGKKVTSLFLDGHEVPFGEEPTKYFTVTALDQPTDIAITVGAGSPPAFSLEYSTDGDMWSSYSAAQTITLDAGKSMMFRRVGDATTTFSSDTSNYWHFIASAPLKVSGNIMSLLDAYMQSTTVGSNCFCRLFENMSNVADASELELPATTLAAECYRGMFSGCSSLSSAPKLPATTLAGRCYGQMFFYCTSLSSAPELPAETLATSCYLNMFNNCTSLTAAPALSATTLADNCYNGMFRGCTSLASAPALPATTLADNCYNSMFRNCTSLTAAPELPATTLAGYCYNSMFQNCKSLIAAPAVLPATTLADGCYSYMFNNCSSLTAAPQLPAETLAVSCYHQMFNGCSSLSAMDVKFTAWSPSAATNNWLSGVAAAGTFICPAALGTDATIQRGTSNCPTGWTVVNPAIRYADYVQTNNYALDTLYKPTVNTSLSTCLSGDANGQCFIGFNNDDSQDYRLFNSSYSGLFFFDMGSDRLQTSSWDTSKWTDISAWNYGFKFTPEGGSEYSATGTAHSTADWDANGTFNVAGTGTGTNCDICIKYLKIYESGTLVKDFRAAVDGNDVAGLYEEVEGVFYYPTGGAWTAYSN